MSRDIYRQNYSLATIKVEMEDLEKEMRELFYLPIINDIIVSVYMEKLKRLEQLKNFKTSFYKE